MALVERNTAEVIGADELPPLMDAGLELRHYIGFEISGKAHLGTGIVSMAKVRDLDRGGRPLLGPPRRLAHLDQRQARVAIAN